MIQRKCIDLLQGLSVLPACFGHAVEHERAQLIGQRWQLVARTGARSEDVLHMLTNDALRRADIGVVLAGVNDISKQVPLRRALRKREEIAAVMRQRAGVRQVVFSALPATTFWLNGMPSRMTR